MSIRVQSGLMFVLDWCHVIQVARVLLVEGGADPHITDHRQGMTPEQVAHSRDKHACVAVFRVSAFVWGPVSRPRRS